MEILPEDCLRVIIRVADPIDLVDLRLVSTTWNRFVNDTTDVTAVASDEQPAYSVPQWCSLFCTRFMVDDVPKKTTATRLVMRGVVVCTVFKYGPGEFTVVGISGLPCGFPALLTRDGDRLERHYAVRFTPCTVMFEHNLVNTGMTVSQFKNAVLSL